MEAVLNRINGKFISLDDQEISRNNKILKWLTDKIVRKMTEVDWLFLDLFQRVYYGGSYFDGLKVGKPDEYDLRLLLKLPDFTRPSLIISDIDGFAYLKREMPPEPKYVHKPRNNQQHYHLSTKRPNRFKNLGRLFDRTLYLDTVKTLAWTESVLERALNEFPTRGGGHFFGDNRFRVTFVKHGPALTLKITGDATIDVDLVPCFVLDNWPGEPFRPNPVPSKPEFSMVPKAPEFQRTYPTSWYWRLSFEEQEREIIKDKATLKPTVRLLKKMRDVMGHKLIASYYIKNFTLGVIEKEADEFWSNPLSDVFMAVLKCYQKAVAKQVIPFYWNMRGNLLKSNNDAWTNISNGLQKVINDVERATEDPIAIAKYLLTPEELERFKVDSQ